MMRHGLVSNAPCTRFVCEQGTKMGWRSRLRVQVHGENGEAGIEVGALVTFVATGSLQILL